MRRRLHSVLGGVPGAAGLLVAVAIVCSVAGVELPGAVAVAAVAVVACPGAKATGAVHGTGRASPWWEATGLAAADAAVAGTGSSAAAATPVLQSASALGD